MARRVGFVVECGPAGADEQLCREFCRAVMGDVACDFACLDNKMRLLDEAAPAAAKLLATGCERVLIVWDLMPAWPDKDEAPCRHAERQRLLVSLAAARLRDKPIYLVCVERQLESWLLADAEKLGEFLSTDAHAYKAIAVVKDPDREPDPKAAVISHFKHARGWRYLDSRDAVRVVKAGPIDLRRLRRSASFARFEAKLAATPPCSGGDR